MNHASKKTGGNTCSILHKVTQELPSSQSMSSWGKFVKQRSLKNVNSSIRGLLVFYIRNILINKNTLCNGCFLTGLSVLFRVFMYSDNVQIKACDWSKASRRCPWRFIVNFKPNQLFQCNRLDEPLKASGRPAVSSRLCWRCPDDRATPSGQ
jgi:hypothetical protein